MSGFPFEDDAKTSLRARCVQAIEYAGYSVTEPPVKIDLPSTIDIKGTLIGDIQARSTNGTQHVFFLRPDSPKTLPGWLQNYAPAFQVLDDIEVYIVVPASNRDIELSCKTLGYGLLSLKDDNTFQGIVEFSRFAHTEYIHAATEEIRKLRRYLEELVSAQKSILLDRFRYASEAVISMDQEKQGDYKEFYLPELEKIENWFDRMSDSLNKMQQNPNPADIKRFAKILKLGYIEDE